MQFTIRVKVDSKDLHLKDECLQALADLLKKKGVYFDVGYDPREMDMDSLPKA